MTGATPAVETKPTSRIDPRPLLVALAIIALATLIRYPLLDIPLDRDEGGYAYGAQRILDGGATYVDFHTMRYPAIFGAYALLLRLFGETHTGIHLGLLFVNALTGLLLCLTAWRWLGRWPAVSALAIFMALSLNGTTEGFSANSEQFVILFVSAGLALLTFIGNENPNALPRPKTGQWFAAFGCGLCMAMAFLMKQHGILFAVFGLPAVAIAVQGGPRAQSRFCAAYAIGAATPVLATWMHLALTGRFAAFWYWTVDYARAYAGGTGIAQGIDILAQRLSDIGLHLLPVALLAAVGLIEALVHRPRLRIILPMLLVFSAAAVCIGFYFRPHYFRLLFPVISLLAAAGVMFLARRLHDEKRKRIGATMLVALACGFILIHQFPLLFSSGSAEASRRISGINPFPESLEIAAWIREHAQPDDRIAVFGSEPQIYFYSGLESATAHIYTYQLMEAHPYARTMQEETIAQIEAARPKFIVSVDIPTSWLIRLESEVLILQWFEEYIAQSYEIAGRVDLVPNGETRYRWGDEARITETTSSYFITVYQRIE